MKKLTKARLLKYIKSHKHIVSHDSRQFHVEGNKIGVFENSFLVENPASRRMYKYADTYIIKDDPFTLQVKIEITL